MADTKKTFRRSRMLGALLGVHAGDSFGATLEFSSYSDVRKQFPNGVTEIQGGGPFNWPPGHATDDTDLTRAVLVAYTKVRQDPSTDLIRAAADEMLNWLNGDWPGRQMGRPPVDIGGATSIALTAYRQAKRAALKDTSRSNTKNEAEVDVERHCATQNPNDSYCIRSLACKLHSMSRKRAVPGRSAPFDQLLTKYLENSDNAPDAELGNDNAAPKDQPTIDPLAFGAGRGSAGNGSLMRCIPTPLFSTAQDDIIRESLQISAVTHNDPRCTIACAAYNIIVSALLDGTEPHAAVKAGLASLENPLLTSVSMGAEAIVQVEKAIRAGTMLYPEDLLKNDLPREYFNGGARGFVLESLTLGIAAVLDPRPLPEVLSDIVCLGRDADTNGAIAGGLLGARDGVDAIPERWLNKLQFREEFEKLCPADAEV